MSEDQADRLQQLEAENARLRQLLDRRGMPGTLRHQTRNALGLMRAILRRSAEGKATVEDFVAHVEGRFDALLRVQTALLSSPDGRIDLATLAADELLAQTIAEGGRATIDGPAVRLEARAAELLGLVLHELATNSVKFGAMTASAGSLAVSWRVQARRLELTWAETGTPDVDAGCRPRGFGMDAIEGMLPYQLRADARLEFLADGLRCTVALQLPPDEA